MNVRIMAATGLLIALSGCIEVTSPAPAPVQPAAAQPAVGSSTDLTVFQGARAGQAEGGIQRLGYELVRTQGLTAYWLNRSTGACAEIVTSDGRYSSVTMLPTASC